MSCDAADIEPLALSPRAVKATICAAGALHLGGQRNMGFGTCGMDPRGILKTLAPCLSSNSRDDRASLMATLGRGWRSNSSVRTIGIQFPTN